MIGVFAMLGQMFPDLLQFVVFNMVKQDVVGGREVKQVEGEEDQMVDPRVDHQKWRHDPGGSCVIYVMAWLSTRLSCGLGNKIV